MLSLRIPSRTKWTHVEDLKDPHKVLLPSRNLVLVVFGEDESDDRPPFTPFRDSPLNLRQGPTIEMLVSGSLDICITVLTHAVRVPIAPRTGWLSSSDRLPFNLW